MLFLPQVRSGQPSVDLSLLRYSTGRRLRQSTKARIPKRSGKGGKSVVLETNVVENELSGFPPTLAMSLSNNLGSGTAVIPSG